jgi:GNAT superfamily N-acetyltransferase
VERQIELRHIQPGKLTQNAHIESFHARLRDECLRLNWFRKLFDARKKIASWKFEYNEERPHSSLGYRTPTEFALRQATVVQQKVIKVRRNHKYLTLLVCFRRRPSRQDHDLFIVECHKASWHNAHSGRYPLENELSKKMGSPTNTIMLSVDIESRSARFGPIGQISVDGHLRSLGIGTYLMAQSILWAQKEYPDFCIQEGLLGFAPIKEDLVRRTAFYKRPGFSFKPEGVPEDKATGFYKERIDLLRGDWDEGKVREVSVAELLNEQEELSGNLLQTNNRKEFAIRQYVSAETKNERLSRVATVLAIFVFVLILFPKAADFLHKLLRHL